MFRWLFPLALLLTSGITFAQVDGNAPPLPPAYVVQPAPPQWWAPCGTAAPCSGADGTVIDLTGESFYILHSANPDPNGACSFAGVNAKPTQRYPLGNPSDVNPALGVPNLILKGGKVIGDISTTVDGQVYASGPGGYCNSTAVDFKNIASTHQEVHQMRVDRVWDAFRFNKEPCLTAGNCNHKVEDVWVSRVRDDAIEADLGYSGLTVKNSLFDGVFSFLSYAPSGSTINDHASDTIHLEDVLVRLEGFPYGELQPDGVTRIVKPYHLSFFKTGTTSTRLKMPGIAMYRTVIAAHVYIPNNTSNIATGTHWANAFRQVDPARCADNVFLWTSDDPLPAVMVEQLPANCFDILTGNLARQYWDIRVANWKTAHAWVPVPPLIEGLIGVPKPVERLAGD